MKIHLGVPPPAGLFHTLSCSGWNLPFLKTHLGNEWICSAKASIRYGLGTNNSFTKSVFMWPVLQRIRALLGCVTVARAWWLIIKTIVNYIIKHSLIYFGHETGIIRETKKVWHLPVSLDLCQLYKIMFSSFFWIRLVDFLQKRFGQLPTSLIYVYVHV